MAGVNEKKLVVVQLSGGNDALNTVIPYNDGNYYDNRPQVHIDPDKALKLDANLAMNPSMTAIKRLWDEGKVAVINGIGYPEPNRSHFRSMDIWHTAEPTKVLTEGWIGKALRELDPKGENVLGGINFGRGLPRAMSCPGVPVASVGNLDTYGLFPSVSDLQDRNDILNVFSQMYGGAQGRDAVSEFLSQTGEDAMVGADILREAPNKYSSNVEYAANPLANSLRDVARVMFSDVGTKVFYTQHGSFDTHGGELPVHSKLWDDVSSSIGDFVDDVREHGYGDSTAILVFSEFGRRVKDNGSGTDHGSGGVAFLIGESVKGGLYGQYPSLKESNQLNGDLCANNDFRSVYTDILEDWFQVDSVPIVNGTFEKFDFFEC
ncbi:MAG: DUF1501 domain-containing protein [SAR202 cluster bacterium]|nr:DUF1501 domain-containing protein [SAR202 cluster bacterium]HAE32828.1 hypothetical protein [Dehalococcoidia bacterium]